MPLLHIFGYPCDVLTQCGKYFSAFLLVQATITLIIKLYKTISIKYNLKNNITLFSSIAHGFFNILTAQMVNDLNDTQNKKPKNPLLKSKSLDHFSDTSTNLINHSTGITSPPPFYTKRPNKLQNLNYFRTDLTFRIQKILFNRLHFLLLNNILHFLFILLQTYIRMTN